MAYIAQWLNEQLNAKQADMVIDDTLTNLRKRSKILDKYVPLKTYDGRKFLMYVVKELNTIASVIAYGAEVPISAQGTMRKITAEMLKSGLSYRYDEETQWAMKEAMELSNAKGVSVQSARNADGSVIQGSDNDLARFLYGTIERLVRSQVDLLDSMTWQIVQTGQLNRVDSRTSQSMNLDYRDVYDTSYNHFPNALTGSDTWDQIATANGINDLYNAVSTYVDTNGYKPAEILMSWKLHNELMQQASTKNSASSLTVTQVGQVSPDMLAALLNARGLPPISLFDEMYEQENTDKSVSKARFLNSNRFVFLNESMGQRAMGATIESGGTQGIYVQTREVSKFPPVDQTISVASMIPVFGNPKLMYSQQVRA